MDLLIYNITKKKNNSRCSIFSYIGVPEDYIIENNKLRVFYRIFRDFGVDTYGKFINNLYRAKNFESDYEFKMYVSYYAHNIIDMGFTWRYTPEGYDYWQNLSNTYREKYLEFTINNT